MEMRPIFVRKLLNNTKIGVGRPIFLRKLFNYTKISFG